MNFLRDNWRTLAVDTFHRILTFSFERRHHQQTIAFCRVPEVREVFEDSPSRVAGAFASLGPTIYRKREVERDP